MMIGQHSDVALPPHRQQVLPSVGSFTIGDIKIYRQIIFVVTIVTMQPTFLSSGMGAAPIPDDKKHLQ